MTYRGFIVCSAAATAIFLLSIASGVAAHSAAPDTAASLAVVKARIVASVLPPAPADRKRLGEIADRDRATLSPDGSWPDVAYADTRASAWKARIHLERLLQMAKAYRTPDQPLYQSAELRGQTLRALDYWLNRDFKNPNWWWNQIGVPQQIGETMLLMEPDLTADERAKGDAILRHAPLSGTGANLVWLAGNNVMRGLLENDAQVVALSFSRMFAELKVVTPDGEGIQADASFHQHGRQLYSGGYGYFFGDDLARFASYSWATPFQIPLDRLQMLLHYLLDGQRWMVRGNIFDYSTIGREITRAELVAVPTDWTTGPVSPVGAAYGMPHTVALLAACADVPRHAELTAFAALLNGGSAGASPNGNRGFWISDYVAHERLGYLTTLRMCSNRMFNSEIVNGEGTRSQHLGDGATFIYQTGNEYGDIFPVWDWQHVPGTTCAQKTQVPFAANQVHIRGEKSFVGSVSDGTYGLAAVDFARGSLTARKAWFYGDEGFVCLGAGITDTSGDDVITSLDQCLLHGPVRVSGAQSPQAQGSRDLAGVRWVWHNGIGYAFPTATGVHVANQPQSGRWSDIGTGSAALITHPVFSLWIDHGAHPDGGTYAYTVLPACPANQVATRATHTVILCNTPTLQAVRQMKIGMLQAAFYQPGTLDARADGLINVDKPCLLQIRRASDSRTVLLAVSNPENLPLTVTVTLSGTYSGANCTPDGSGKTLVRLTLPAGEAAGSSLVETLGARH